MLRLSQDDEHLPAQHRVDGQPGVRVLRERRPQPNDIPGGLSQVDAGQWDTSGPPQLNPTDDYYKDPTNIGRWAEKRLGDMGVEMPEQAREMIDAARDGEMPPAIKDI